MMRHWLFSAVGVLVLMPLGAIAQTAPAMTTVQDRKAAVPNLSPTAYDLDVQPVPPAPRYDFSLPAVEPLPPQPAYIQEPPVWLEIKLSKRRVTVYRGNAVLKSYPIAVGKPGWETPVGTYSVRQMFRNPTWVHPLKQGIEIPGGDPENPLGKFWIGFWTDGKNWIGFHGTPNPGSVGQAASHGCVRMFNKDIEELFKKVSLGTAVKVVK